MLGEGAFGEVWKATMKESSNNVTKQKNISAIESKNLI